MSIAWHDLVEVEDNKTAVNATLQEKATLVGRVGLMMLSVGTGAWRVRASMNKISRALNIVCNADIGLVSISYTCIEGSESYTGALSNNGTGVNTDKLDMLEFFADSFADRADKYSVEQFHRILDNIQAMPGNYNALNVGLASGLACCAFTFLLGGGPIEMILAFFGAFVGMFVRKKLLEHHITLVANVICSVAAACATYVALLKLLVLIFGMSTIHESGYICAMLFIIPGFPLITGGIDIAKLDLRSGLERIAYAVIIIGTATLTGWLCAFAYGFEPMDFPAMELNPILKIALRMITSLCGVYGFSFLFNSKRKMAVTAAIIGMIANTVRLEILDYTGFPVAFATFLGALTAGLLASLFKKYVGYPRITLTVPSIVIMVPGMFLYKGIFFMGLGELNNAGMWLSKALLIIIALPLGLIVARIFTDTNFRKSS